jgi:hypothetical protein
MRTMITISLLLFSSGCACSDCFTQDAKSMFMEERDSAVGLRTKVVDFAREEFASVRGIRRDLTAGAFNEHSTPNYYLDNISDIFCPCP